MVDVFAANMEVLVPRELGCLAAGPLGNQLLDAFFGQESRGGNGAGVVGVVYYVIGRNARDRMLMNRVDKSWEGLDEEAVAGRLVVGLVLVDSWSGGFGCQSMFRLLH